MAKYNYTYVDGAYREMTEEEIDAIQNQQTKPEVSFDEFKSAIMTPINEYQYVAGTNSYDVTNMVKSEFEKESQNLNSKYSSDLSLINTDYDTAKKELDSNREKELQNQYIQREKQLDVLPANLAQTGLDGGANQSQTMKIETDYQGQRNEIESYFLNELNKLIAIRDEELRKEQEAYNESVSSLAKTYDTDLKAAASKDTKTEGYYTPIYNFSNNIRNTDLIEEDETHKSPITGNKQYDMIK